MAILIAIHARIPMPTMENVKAVQLEHAKADARFWETMADMAAGDIADQKMLLATAQQAIVKREPLAADTAAKAQAAKGRLAQVEKGEAVVIPLPMTRKDMLRIAGMTETQAQHYERVAAIGEAGEDRFQLLVDEGQRRKAKVEKAVVRELHRKVQLPRA